MEEKKIPGHSARPHPDQAAMSGGQKRPCLPNPRLDANFKGMFTKDCEDSHIALKSFLSAMIGEPVTDVIVRENEEATQYKGQKGVRYDINGFPYGKPMTFCYAEIQRYRPIRACA